MEFERKSPAEKKSPTEAAVPSPRTTSSPRKQAAEAGGTPGGGTPQLKRGGGSQYRGYLNRAGPQALGSKEIPEVVVDISSRNQIDNIFFYFAEE